MEHKRYIVELERGVWIAPWDGDPGRTIVIENARVFKKKTSAQRALLRAKKLYPNRGFKNGAVRLAKANKSEQP